jgi:putative hydrolase of the HAD superfamily
MFDILAFDADDTLWNNEIYYTQAKDEFVAYLRFYEKDDERIKLRLDEIEEGNVEIYGYGIKSFTLSMLEAALEISQGLIRTEHLGEIIALGRNMLTTPVEVFPQTEAVLAKLAQDWEMMLITKGDVFEQSKKIERTGLGGYFRHIEIVGEKTTPVYRALIQRHRLDPRRFLMVGNSLRSDILPVLELGGQAVYIPYANTWAHEHKVDHFSTHDGYYEVEHLGELPELLEQIRQDEK